jgi:hypothetical protein
MGALSNALANAASSLVASVGQNVGGLITGTNPLTQPQIGQIFNTNIPGTPLVSTRDYFLFQLNSWVTAFPLMSQWIAVIESYPAALRTDILRGLERTTGSGLGFDINLAKTILTSYPFQRVTGCIFANNVVLPEESISIKTAPLENNRGFVPGVVSGERRSYADKPLALSFFETSTSFLDFVIRPWIILAGHYGFVARKGDTNRTKSIYNVKTNITLLHFNRTYQNISQIPRKVFRFYNCVPISVPTQEYGYEEPNTVKSFVTNWAYTNYTIENNLYLPLPNLIAAWKQGGGPQISPLNSQAVV